MQWDILKSPLPCPLSRSLQNLNHIERFLFHYHAVFFLHFLQRNHRETPTNKILRPFSRGQQNSDAWRIYQESSYHLLKGIKKYKMMAFIIRRHRGIWKIRRGTRCLWSQPKWASVTQVREVLCVKGKIRLLEKKPKGR